MRREMPKSLKDWPRPPNDTGIGIHLGTDMRLCSIQEDIAHMKEMGMTWGTVCSSNRDMGLRACAMLAEEGIEPIWRPYLMIDGGGNFGTQARIARDMGVRYLQIFNEPGDTREWNRRPLTWLHRFYCRWIRAASNVLDNGCYPGLQLLGTEDLLWVFEWASQDNALDIFENVWFCPHNYGLKNPPDYYNKGDGGSIGVLSFLDFADTFKEALGYVPPFICGEGGWFFGGVDNQKHACWTRLLLDSFRSGLLPRGYRLPDYLFAICPWILSGPGCDPWYGWDTATQTIEAVKGLTASGWTRKFSWDEGEEPEPEKNWRVVSFWQNKRDVLLLRHDCQDTFGGHWDIEERDD